MLDAPEDLKKVSQLGQMLTSSTLAMKAQPSTEDLMKNVSQLGQMLTSSTLAMKAQPSTVDLMKAPSRFLLKPKDNENMDK